jgi:hypothetical protein
MAGIQTTAGGKNVATVEFFGWRYSGSAFDRNGQRNLLTACRKQVGIIV